MPVAAATVALLVVFGQTPAPVPSSDGPGRVVRVAAGEVRLVEGGELAATVATDPPSEVDLRELRLTRTDGRGYQARLDFAGPFQHRRDEGRQHVVFASLQPPQGARMRVALLPDGTGALQRADGDRFVTVAPLQPVVDGGSVTLPVPASTGVTPAWEVQGHVLLFDGPSGYHAHTPQVSVAALAGSGADVPFAATAGLIEGGAPVLWRPGHPLPGAARPVRLRVEPRGDRVAAIVAMAAPPGVLITVEVARQEVRLAFGPDGPTVTWDARTRTVTPADVTAEVNGSDLVFSLPAPGRAGRRAMAQAAVPAGAVAGASDSLAAPDRAGRRPMVRATIPAEVPPIGGLATSVPDPAGRSCGSQAVTFRVTVSVIQSQLLVRADATGFEWRGPIDLVTGRGELTGTGGQSPATVEGAEGDTIRMVVRSRPDCVERVRIKLDQRLDPLTPTAAPTTVPTQARGFGVLDRRWWLTAESRVLDSAGNGLWATTPSVPLSDWLGAGAGTGAEPASKPEGSFPWSLICAALVLLGLAGAGGWLWTRRGDAVAETAPSEDADDRCAAEREAARRAASAYESARLSYNAAEGRVAAAEQALARAVDRRTQAEQEYAPTQTARDRVELLRDVPEMRLPPAADEAQTTWEKAELTAQRAEEELRAARGELGDVRRNRDEAHARAVEAQEALDRCRGGLGTPEQFAPEGQGATDPVM